MTLKHYPSDKLKQEILSIVSRRLNLETHKVFFFGSRVVKAVDDRADIDIGIEGPDKIPPLMMAAIKEDIDHLSVLYKIDVVDFKTVSEDFRKVAMGKIEFIA